VTSPSRRGFVTADGSNTGAFGPIEWGLLTANSLIWGSSFLWIAIGVDVLHPAAVTFIRAALGTLALGMLKSSRKPVDREALPAVAVVGIMGTLLPGLFFAFAEQRIESSVAGMLQSAGPLFVLALSIAMARKTPGRIQMIGLFIGFIGGVLLALPNVTGAGAEPLGVLLVVIAVACYGVSSNIVPPLVQDFGGTPVMFRALLISTVILLPYGIYGLFNSGFSWMAVLAMLILGIFGTGVARTTFAVLVSRAGAPRASLVSYFVPVVAVTLGIVFRGDTVSTLEFLGLALILSSAWFVSRSQK
jgi:drug/metabolite transporter (DMT)-like permease